MSYAAALTVRYTQVGNLRGAFLPVPSVPQEFLLEISLLTLRSYLGRSIPRAFHRGKSTLHARFTWLNQSWRRCFPPPAVPSSLVFLPPC